MTSLSLYRRHNLWLGLYLLCLSLLLALGSCQPSKTKEPLLTKEERQANLNSLEIVWKTIGDTHYDPTLGGLDWQRVHDELLDNLNKTQTMSEARLVLTDMVSRLNQSHFAIIPGPIFQEMRSREVKKKEPQNPGTGTSGIDLRMINEQMVVTAVETSSPAANAGVLPGWVILKVDDIDIPPLIKRIARQYEKKTWKNLMVTFSIKKMLLGPIGQHQVILFEDGNSHTVEKTFFLAKGKGEHASIGYFDLGYVWCEKRKLEGNIGYIAFNGFINLGKVMPLFNQAIQEFMDTRGIIIDIRGNPGGLGIMATGMAGWFIDKKGLSLGTLITRGNQIHFAILPRPVVYHGLLVILIDSCTASTAECFAAGLQDLGRAHIFGENSAGAALPSAIKQLPNGDAFQYAIANYVSTGGRRIEGYGVMLKDPIPLTREDLLQNHDLVLEAAVQWISDQNM